MDTWQPTHHTLRDRTVALRHAGQGRPLLFVHGSACSGGMWRPYAAALAEEYRCTAVDLPGYGRSAPYRSCRDIITEDTRVLVDLVDELPRGVTLVGHSYGAAQALLAALARSDRISRVIAIEPVLFPLLREVGDWEAWHAARQIALLTIADLEQGQLRRAARRFIGYWSGPLARYLVAGKMLARIVRLMPRVGMEMRAMFEATPVMRRLAACDVPVDLLVGDRTRREARQAAMAIHDCLPRAQLQTLRRCRHFTPVARPAAATAAVSRLLAQNPALSC